MQGDDGANDGDGWAFNAAVYDLLGNGGEGADDDALIASCAIVDDGDRQILVGTVADKLAGQIAELRQPHIDGDGLVRFDQGLPIEIDLAFLAVAGDENTGLSVIAMGEGDARIGRATGSCRDPGHHLKRYAMFGQHLDFFAAPAER